MSFLDRFKLSSAEVANQMPQNPYDVSLSAALNTRLCEWRERMQMAGGRPTVDDQRDIAGVIGDVIREREQQGDTVSIEAMEESVRTYIFNA